MTTAALVARSVVGWLAPALLVLGAAVDAVRAHRGVATPLPPDAVAVDYLYVPRAELWFTAEAPSRDRLLARAPWSTESPPMGAGWVRRRDTRTRNRALAEPADRRTRDAWVLSPRDDTRTERGSLSLREQLAQAHVRIVRPDGSSRSCTDWHIDRWRCGAQPWLWVGPVRQVVRGEPNECVWMHPTEEGILRVELPLAAGTYSLRGRFSLSDAAVLTPEGASVQLRVLVDEHEVVRRTQRNRAGWTTLRAHVASEGTASVLAVEVQADATGARHFCVDLRLEPVDAELREGSP